MNKILNEDRAIVTEIEGTTRYCNAGKEIVITVSFNEEIAGTIPTMSQEKIGNFKIIVPGRNIYEIMKNQIV